MLEVDPGSRLSKTWTARYRHPFILVPHPLTKQEKGQGSVAAMSADRPLPDLDLSGRWRATVASDELRRVWNDDTFADTDFVDVEVPGHWQTNPAFVDNNNPLLYRRRFQSLGMTLRDRAWLQIDGLFYQGDVWLDGAYLGDTEGYFVPHRFEITDYLATRHDHLLGIEVTCDPPGDRDAKRALTGVFQDGPFLDDDWNPGGIWRSVHVHRTGPITITAGRVLCTDATAERALVTFHLTVDAADASPVTIRTTIGARDHEQSRTLAAGENQLSWTIPIEHPALWWPHALGDQPLHDVSVAAFVGDTISTNTDTSHTGTDQATDGPSPSDIWRTRIGLRQVAMRNFIVSVNGERLFCKGANIGPISGAPASDDPAAYVNQIAVAVDAGLDLLRVYGHISRPELYQAADEAGMLLWQDLPLNRAYHRSVRRRAVRQARVAVDLLGHHPSIAVWCGHNEPDTAATVTRDGRTRSMSRLFADHEVPNWNRSVLDHSIRRALSAADPTRPVVASSGVWPHPPTFDGTDVHLSLGWRHGEIDDLSRLARTMPRVVRFVGEFGSPSVPDAADFCEPWRWPDLDWERLSHDHGYEAETFASRIPPDAFATFAEWRAATQNYQAQIVRTTVETLRRLKYSPTGGFNVFFLTDTRPAISPSLIDHSGNAKPALAAFTAACEPVIVTLDPWPSHLHPGDDLLADIHVVSDLHSPLDAAEVDVHLWWDGGERTWRFGGDLDADSVTWIGRLDTTVPDDIGPVVVDLRLRVGTRAWASRYVGTVHTH